MNIRNPFRAAAALFLIGLLAIPLAACSSKTPTASAAESVRAASNRSTSSESVAFEMNITIEGVAGFDLDVAAEGAYDIANGQMRMTLDTFGQEVQAVSDGEALYLQMPMLGDSWFKQDIDSSNAAIAGAAEDPTKVLEWLTQAGDDVEDLGEDEVRGETARHYRVILDMRETAARLDGDQREQLEKAIELLGEDALDVDLWVNDAGLPVRLTYEMSFANSEIGQLKGAAMQFSMEYFDWGQPVTVTLPDPDDVQDASGLLGRLLAD